MKPKKETTSERLTKIEQRLDGVESRMAVEAREALRKLGQDTYIHRQDQNVCPYCHRPYVPMFEKGLK